MERDTPVQISDTKPVRRLVALLQGGWIEEALLAVEDPLERAELAREFHEGLPLCIQSEAISEPATDTAMTAAQPSASAAASTMRRAMVTR
jgi:hypothetical protein